METEWISAAKAYELIAQANGPFVAGRAICSRAHAGLIEARAVLLLWGVRRSENCPVPEAFWWAHGEGALEQNWPLGDFVTWIDRQIHCRAFGVEFRKSDIQKMLPGEAPRVFSRSEPGNYASAARCMAELRSTLQCGEGEVEPLIVKSCRSGILPSRCTKITIRTRDRFGENIEEVEGAAIPDWFWEDCVDDDVILDWKQSRFAGRGIVDGDERKVRIEGAEFEVGAIIDLEARALRTFSGGRETVDPAPSDTTDQPKQLRALRATWSDWIAELVSETHDHGFPNGIGSQGQEELIKRVADGLAKRGITAPGRSTVQPVVQAALDRHRSAKQ
jgi:hypothetical protein